MTRGHILGLASLLLLRGRLTGEEVARVLDTPPPRRARLGLQAVAVVKEVYRGDWYDPPGGGPRHLRRQVDAHGTWYKALYHAARALLGGERVALALAD